MRRVNIPGNTGASDTEAISIAERRCKVNALQCLAGFQMIEIVEPGLSLQHIGMRSGLDLGFGPAELNALSGTFELKVVVTYYSWKNCLSS